MLSVTAIPPSLSWSVRKERTSVDAVSVITRFIGDAVPFSICSKSRCRFVVSSPILMSVSITSTRGRVMPYSCSTSSIL